MATDHKGLTFRASRSGWVRADGTIGTRVTMKVLKRHSCDPEKCEKCRSVLDWVSESLSNCIDMVDFNCENGQAYKLDQNSCTDYETGYEEVDSLFFRKVDLKVAS